MRGPRFLWRLYAGYVLLILVTTAAVGLLVDRWIEEATLQETERTLQRHAVLLREIANPALAGGAVADLEARLRALGAETGVRLTVIRDDGAVLADSDEDPARMDNHSGRPEIAEARLRGAGTAIRHSDTLGRSLMYAACAVTLEGRCVGFARAALPLDLLEDRQREVRRHVVWGAASAAGAALLLGYLFARRVTRPLGRLRGMAEALADGQSPPPAPVESEDEFGALARAFNTMAEQSRARETVRRDFIANVSHELKTPVTAISGLVETVLSDDAMPASTRREFLERAQAQSLRLTSLVRDLLTLSRLEAGGGLDLRPVDWREPVGESVQAMKASAESKGLHLESELPATPVAVRGDPESLRQMADNLVGNAVRYTPSGGRVRVCLREDAADALLDVEDTGIGIEPEHLGRLFDRFYRADKARSRELGGTGLGLSIVKHVAQALQGDVSVESVPGRGSLFRVRLPLLR